MRKIVYKIPVIKQIHLLHMMIDDQQKIINDQQKIINDQQKINTEQKQIINDLKRRLSVLEKERAEQKKHNELVKKNMRYDFFRGLPAEKYEEALCEWYYFTLGKRLNIICPRTFNEKIQWLKLYDSTPLKTMLTDKVAVREWVAQQIGKQYLIPCLGVWDTFEQIDFDSLPARFVLKANHGCGWNIIVKDKNNFDKKDARSKFHDWLGRNYAWCGLELQYKDIIPKIYAEQYIENHDSDLYDYKFMCFNGQIQYVWVITERYTKRNLTIYDTEWNRQIYRTEWPQSDYDIEKPDSFEEMKQVAQQLCRGFSFVRVDLYNVNSKVYFGEMTFTSGNGIYRFFPEEFEMILGDKIILPQKKGTEL